MNSQEELLAKLRAIDAETQPPPAELKPVSPPPRPGSNPPTHGPEAQTAELLAKLDALDRETLAPQSPPPLSRPAPPGAIAPGGGSMSPQQLAWQPFPNVIERLKQFTQGQLAAHAAQNRAKAQRAQEIARAEAWLEALDPLSDDGFWFEQFAEGYPSRLEAALVFWDPARQLQG